MRAEDKRIGIDKDEAEVEQTRRQDRARVSEIQLEAGDDLATEQDASHESAKTDHYQHVMRVVQSLFRGDLRPLDGVTGFDQEEMKALEYLEAAIRGRDAKLTHLVYAEDRRDLLEQALAVLYPTMSHGLEQDVAGLREQHDELVGRVCELRDHLAQLEDAEGDVIELRQQLEMAKGDGDKGDGDKDDDDKGDPDDKGDKDDADAPDAAAATDDDDDDDDAPPGDVGDPGVVP